MAALLLALGIVSAPRDVAASAPCGELVRVETHDRTTTRYALAVPRDAPVPEARIALVLLVGGGGHLDLDDQGCPRALRGNSLVRSLPHFHATGLVTALVDAPSDHQGADGLAGFRADARHAADLGRVIVDVRARTGAAVWLVGTSRGTISVVNAATRLSGPSAPDGLVLTSALMAGSRSRPRPWLTQTVFDLPLESIRSPVLLVGHADDTCLRSLASGMRDVTRRLRAARTQVVVVTGGPGRPGPPDPSACEGRSPHGFVEQEAEVAAGIARFVRGAPY